MEAEGEGLDDTLLKRRGVVVSTKRNTRAFATGDLIEEGVTHDASGMTLRVLHKQGGAGCLHPAEFWPLCAWMCPVLKRRTIDWIGENAILRNTSFFLPFYPLSFSFCTTSDYSRMRLLDRSPFYPCCHGLGSPCGARGYATEEDMSEFLCFDCRGSYNRWLKPCWGECLWAVPCENGSSGFGFSMRYCLVCVMIPVGCCMADSKTYRTVLIQQVAHTRGVEITENQRRVLGKSPPEVDEMAR